MNNEYNILGIRLVGIWLLQSSGRIVEVNKGLAIALLSSHSSLFNWLALTVAVLVYAEVTYLLFRWERAEIFQFCYLHTKF